MKPTQIIYARLISDNNHGHEKIEVTIQLEDGETATAGLAKAREFVAKNSTTIKEQDELKSAKWILQNKEKYKYVEVAEAEKTIFKYEHQDNNDLPF